MLEDGLPVYLLLTNESSPYVKNGRKTKRQRWKEVFEVFVGAWFADCLSVARPDRQAVLPKAKVISEVQESLCLMIVDGTREAT